MERLVFLDTSVSLESEGGCTFERGGKSEKIFWRLDVTERLKKRRIEKRKKENNFFITWL